MFRLSAPWSSGAVLQHSKSLRLCGQTTSDMPLTMVLQRDQASITLSGNSDSAGAFGFAIDALPPSGPWTLRISTDGSQLIQLDDLWFGELLLFAGQSNVGWPLARYPEQLSAAMTQLQNHQRLRCYQSASTDFQAPGQWLALSPEHCARWPALLYHFSQCYQPAEADVMLGLVDISWPGSAIDAWTEHADGASATQAWQSGALFAARLKPWLQQPFSALVWYQGEQNAMGKDAAHYGDKLQHWLHNCRQVAGWEFPLLLVQIAGFGQSGLPQLQHGFVLVRQAQQYIAATAHQVMLVSAADLGAEDDIHPPFKAELARRLALQLPQLLNAGLGCRTSQLTAQLLERNTTTARLRLPQACSWQHSGPLDGFFIHSPAVGWQSAPAVLHAAHHQVHITVPADADTLCYGMSARPHLTLYTAEGLPLLPGIWTLPVFTATELAGGAESGWV